MRASLRAALRVGLVGGVLFGLAATLAAAGLDRRLLSEPQDLVVLALYLVVAFALVTGVAALAGGLLAAWARRLGRRARPEPRPQRRPRGRPRRGRLRRAVGPVPPRGRPAPRPGRGARARPAAEPRPRPLRLARGGGRPLGGRRLAAPAARRASRAGASSRSSSAPPRSLPSSWPWPRGSPARPSADAPDYAVVPTGLRVRVLAIDGLERRMAEHLVAGGEMPALGALLASGARARLRAEPERVPGHRLDDDRHRPGARGPRHPVGGHAPHRRAADAGEPRRREEPVRVGPRRRDRSPAPDAPAAAERDACAA